MMDKSAFRRKRKRLGLTQEQLAKRLELSRVTIARYETGVIPIPRILEMALELLALEKRT